MSLVEEALVSILRNNAAVAALVSTRIYPVMIPQGATLPVIEYRQLSGQKEHSHDANADLARPRYQFTAISASYSQAKTLAAAIVAALDNYQGTVSGVKIDAVQKQNQMDLFTRTEDEGNSTFSSLVDFVVFHH